MPASTPQGAFHAEKLWDAGYRGAGVKMGVFDTGIRDDHPHVRNIRRVGDSQCLDAAHCDGVPAEVLTAVGVSVSEAPSLPLLRLRHAARALQEACVRTFVSARLPSSVTPGCWVCTP